MSKFKVEGIVEVYDVLDLRQIEFGSVQEEQGGGLALVMEFIEGRSLREVLRDRLQFNEPPRLFGE